jgi:hypothetical protein
MILAGCAISPTSRLAQTAAERQGAAEAGVSIERQPDECRGDWPLLDRAQLVGHEALSGVKRYESYITGTINPAKARCFAFNETIRTGLAGRPN